MSVYNENRDNNMSLHDEIKEQNAKMKGQPFSVKFSYFKEYYLKTTIVIAVIVIALISLLISIFTGPEDTAFGCYFINNTGPASDDTLLNDFVAKMDIDTKKHEVFLDTSIYYNPDNQDPYAYVSIEKVMAIISTGELDIIVGDEGVTDYYAYGSCFCDITTVLPADLLEQFQDKLYYYTTEEGETIPVGIYIDDSPKLAKYGYYDHTRPIFGIIANSNDVDTAIAFLRYLYE